MTDANIHEFSLGVPVDRQVGDFESPGVLVATAAKAAHDFFTDESLFIRRKAHNVTYQVSAGNAYYPDIAGVADELLQADGFDDRGYRHYKPIEGHHALLHDVVHVVLNGQIEAPVANIVGGVLPNVIFEGATEPSVDAARLRTLLRVLGDVHAASKELVVQKLYHEEPCGSA